MADMYPDPDASWTLYAGSGDVPSGPVTLGVDSVPTYHSGTFAYGAENQGFGHPDLRRSAAHGSVRASLLSSSYAGTAHSFSSSSSSSYPSQYPMSAPHMDFRPQMPQSHSHLPYSQHGPIHSAAATAPIRAPPNAPEAYHHHAAQGGSAHPSSIIQAIAAPPVTPVSVQCTWQGRCGIVLDDITPSGLTRHLRDYHFDPPAGNRPWHNKNRGLCEWLDWDGPCNRDMNYASFGKHIAAVHLRSTALKCQYCGHELGRPDSLDRHIKMYCPQRPIKDECV